MTRDKILEMYFKAMNEQVLYGEEDLGFSRGLTFFCKAALVELYNEEQEIEKAVQNAESAPKSHRGKGIAMPEEDVKRIYNLADLGKSQIEIARIVGCSPGAVCRRLKGYKRKNLSEPTKGVVDWIRDLSGEGLPLNEIAERVGYSESVVAKYAGGSAE